MESSSQSIFISSRDKNLKHPTKRPQQMCRSWNEFVFAELGCNDSSFAQTTNERTEKNPDKFENQSTLRGPPRLIPKRTNSPLHCIRCSPPARAESPTLHFALHTFEWLIRSQKLKLSPTLNKEAKAAPASLFCCTSNMSVCADCGYLVFGVHGAARHKRCRIIILWKEESRSEMSALISCQSSRSV